MKSNKICVLGSLNVDLTVSLERFHQPGETVTGTDFATYTGGKGGNQAVAAARLGAPVSMIGCLGEDAYGQMYREALVKNQVDTRFVSTTAEAPTGVALIEVDAQGENRIAVVPGANRLLSTDLVTEAFPALNECGVLLLQLEVPIESVTHAAAVARRLGARVVLDPAPARPVPDALLMLCDYVSPNEHELHTLTGMPTHTDEEALAACTALLNRGATAVINKRGAQGALFVTREGARMIPGHRVDAVDTTAAGDTFNAAFAVGLSMEMPVMDALLLANAAAALSTTAPGAQSAMPNLFDACALVESGTV